MTVTRPSPWSIGILVALFLCATAGRVFAQTDVPGFYSVCEQCAKHLGGNGVAGPWATKAECEAGKGNESFRKQLWSDCFYSGSTPSATEYEALPISGAHLAGLGAGLLGGSFWENPGGVRFLRGGAALGMGSLGLMSLAFNAKHMPAAEVVVISALDGASLMVGLKDFQTYNQEWANPNAPVPVDKFAQNAALGAGIGAAAGLGLKAVMHDLREPLGGFGRKLGRLGLLITNRRIGAVVQW